jgi:hypothetical protein
MYAYMYIHTYIHTYVYIVKHISYVVPRGKGGFLLNELDIQ